MQNVDVTGLDELSKKLDTLLKDIPAKRRAFHERAGQLLKEEVDRSVSASGVNDSHGKVRGWQVPSVGSGGGYAAIRAVKGETGANSPGAITNYLENGHKTRAVASIDTGKWKSKKFRVDGYHFYATANATIQGKVIKLAEEFANDIAKGLT